MRKSLHLEMDLTLEPRFTKEFVVKKKDDITLDIALKNDKLPVLVDNQVARLFVRKQDGSVIVQGGTEELGDGSIVMGGNVVRIHLKNSATNTTGLCYAELELEDENGVMATHSFIFEVIDRLDDIDEAIKATDDIYILKELEEFIIQAKKDIAEVREVLNELKANMEQAVEDFNNAIKEFEEKLEGTNTDIDEKVAHFEELIAGLEGRIEDFENAYKNAGEELALIKEEALKDLTNFKNWTINKLEYHYSEYVKTLGEAYEGYKGNLEEYITEQKEIFYRDYKIHSTNLKRLYEEYIEDMYNKYYEYITNMEGLYIGATEQIEKDKIQALEEIEAKRVEILQQISDSFNLYMTDMDIFFESCIGEMEEKMGQALRNISDATESSLEAIQDKADDIMEQINNIEIGSIEGVNQAVADAQKRLQEEAIKATWDVQQAGREEEERLTASLGQTTSELRDGLEASADSYLEDINEAGREMVELVDGLEADISEGLTTIQNTINTGKTEIKDLSDSYLNRIETEGQEIVEAVRDLEITTQDNIERINEAGLSNRQALESKANAEISSINAVASNRKNEINELAEAKKEQITTAGQDKLDEISGILGVTKGETEELLEEVREQLNTGKAQISSSISEGLTNIENLKNTSVNEMSNAKDGFINEILGAEVELKEDFKVLRDAYIQEIDNKGQDKIEALNNLIERISDFELEIERNLVNADKKAENLEKTLENVDNKMEQIRPILDMLEEMKNVCLTLQQENAEANENIEELEYLHVEADTRIVTLRMLIEEVKNLELELEAYIDAKGGNHDEILLRIDMLEQSVIAIDDEINTLKEAIENIVIPDISHLATKEELNEAINSIEIPTIDHLVEKTELINELKDYATKSDLEKIKPEGMNIIGKFITGTGSFYIPENMKNAVLPANYADKEVKYTMIHRTRVASYDRYFKTFFFVDLNDIENKKYVYANSSNYIKLDNMKLGTDYVQMYSETTTATPSMYSSNNSYTYSTSFDAYSSYSFVYDYDFDIYNQDGSEIAFKSLKTKEEGYGDFNDAVNDGYYLIDLDLSSFMTILNAPKISASKVKGFLEVLNGVQTLRLQDGQAFSREIGGAWSNILDNAVKNVPIATIGASSTVTPELFKNFREHTRRITNMETRTILFKQNSTIYTKAMFEVSPGADVKGYLSIASSQLTLNIVGAHRSQVERYTTSTDKFELIENASGIAITMAVKGSEIYATDFPIYLDSAYTRLYKDITPANYSGGAIISDINDANQIGVYSVEASGNVINAPVENINGILEVTKATNGDIYQELKANDNVARYSRVYSGGKWSIWSKTSDDFIGKIGIATKYSVDKDGVFDDLPTPPNMTGTEYLGRILFSSGTTYRCIHLYKPLVSGAEPFIYTTTSTTSGCEGITYSGRDFGSLNSITYYKNVGDTAWTETYGWYSFQDVYNSHIYDNTVPIYTDTNKTSVYREARTSDKITNIDACNQAGKYLVNIAKEEYKEIQNLPNVKIDKDLDTILYVTVEGNKVMQEIIINGVTYTRTIGDSWVGLSDGYVKTDIIDSVEGVEIVDNPEEAIEALNVDEIYATCPYQDSHKTPTGTIDFKDSSNRYYRWRCYGKGSGFYRTTNNYIGVYANSNLYTERYTYNNGTWALNTSTSSSGLYVSVGSSGEILACDIDVVGGSNYNSIDKTTIVRKADVKDVIIPKTDFNNCMKQGVYKVDILENTIAENSPVESAISGIMEVKKFDNIIRQELTTIDNTLYIRIFNGTEWTEWTTDGGNLDEEIVEVEEIGRIEILPKFEWDIVPDKTIYNNLPVPENYEAVFCGKLGNYYMVAFFNRPIEIDILEANGKKYLKVRDYNFADVIGSYYYTSSKSWGKEGASYVDKYYGGDTSTGYSLTACYFNNFKIYNQDGTLYKGSYLDKDIKATEDFNEAVILNTYTVKQENEVIANSPIEEAFSGVMEVVITDNIITQKLTTSEDVLYSRVRNNEEWTEWTTNSGGLDEETSNKINDLLIPNNEKINTFNYTNADGMLESYNWMDLNGFKIMWINVKLSEQEYNSGTTGLMMKTLNIPEEAQIFNNIIMANVTSYNRPDKDTLSRVVQNAEIISNKSIRGRWRHTDGVSPNIDNFTIMAFGF